MRVMKPLPGRILVVLLALLAGIALGAGLVGALRTPAPPNVDPIQLEGERGDEADEDATKKKRGRNDRNKGKDTRDQGKEKPSPGNGAPVPQNEPQGGGAPPPPPPPPPADDDDGGDDDGGDDDGGGDD